jgi:hypothetical protein
MDQSFLVEINLDYPENKRKWASPLSKGRLERDLACSDRNCNKLKKQLRSSG